MRRLARHGIPAAAVAVAAIAALATALAVEPVAKADLPIPDAQLAEADLSAAEAQRGVGAQAGSGDAGAGEGIYRDSCAMCHGTDATGMMGMHPSLRGAVDRLSREGLEVTVRNGRRTQPPMPAFEGRLTAAEIDDVVAYVASLPDGDRNFGPGVGMGGMMDGDDGWVSAAMVAMMVAFFLVIAASAAAVAWFVSRRRTPTADDGRIEGGAGT